MPEDIRLVESAARGDRGSWDLLLARFRPAAFAAARAVSRDDADAEDAVQAASIRAWGALAGLGQAGAFAAWYLRIVRNASHDLRRKARSAVEIEDGMAITLDGPAERALRAEGRDLVRAAMRALASESEEYAEVLFLRYGEDLGYADMARQLGESVSAVESRLFRARKALAAILKRMGYEEH